MKLYTFCISICIILHILYSVKCAVNTCSKNDENCSGSDSYFENEMPEELNVIITFTNAASNNRLQVLLYYSSSH